MKAFSSNIFLLTLLILGLIVCNSSCSDDEAMVEVFDQEVVLQMTQFGWPSRLYDRVFVSNKKGEIVDCRYSFWIGAGATEFVNEIPLEDDYLDLTFSEYPDTELDRYRLYTYTDIKRKDWTIHREKVANGTFGQQFDIEFFWKPDPTVSPESYFIYNACGKNNLQLYKWLSPEAPYDESRIYCNKLFIQAYEPNGVVSYKMINGVVNNDSILLDFDNFTPLAIADLTTDIDGDIQTKEITGLSEAGKIETSTKFYDPQFYSNFTTTPYGDLEEGKIIFPENVFEEFLVDIEITSADKDYFLSYIGGPIYDYSPSPSKITIENPNVNSFLVTPNGEEADFYGITWEVKNSDFDIEWTVYHEAGQTEKMTLPEMPECVIQIQTKLSRSDFKLKSIESYHYENISSLEEYINIRFDPDIGVEGFELDVIGGRFEKKTVRP